MNVESEPSLVSAHTQQLQTTTFRGPEFAHTMMEMDGPYVNVNKGEIHMHWTAVHADSLI